MKYVNSTHESERKQVHVNRMGGKKNRAKPVLKPHKSKIFSPKNSNVNQRRNWELFFLGTNLKANKKSPV